MNTQPQRDQLRAFRRDLIERHFTPSEDVLDKLMIYGELPSRRIVVSRLPLNDDRTKLRWARYLGTPEPTNASAALLDAFIELDFPINKDVKNSMDYQGARKTGQSYVRHDACRQHFDPSLVRFTLLETPAGVLPVILFAFRANFEDFIRAIAQKNEPVDVPKTMGALLVNGYNNWGYLNSVKATFFEANPGTASEQWATRFKEILADPGSYKEAIAILSAGPYSGLTPGQVGVSDENWIRVSPLIRMWHEATHLLTKRTLGEMRRHLVDELIADVAGVIQATGAIQRAWLRAFHGCGEQGEASTGRLRNYLDDEYAHGPVFPLLQALIGRAIDNIAGHFVQCPHLYEDENRIAYLLLASILPLETLALSPELDQLPRQAMRLAALLFSEEGVDSEPDRCFFRAEKEPHVSFYW